MTTDLMNYLMSLGFMFWLGLMVGHRVQDHYNKPQDDKKHG
jgi:hypothetical protein